MGTVYQWIQNLSVWLVLSAVILHLVPGKDYGKYVRFFSGMVLLLLFLEPMLKLTGTDGMITKLYEGNLAKEDQAEKELLQKLYESADLTEILPEEYQTAFETAARLCCGEQLSRYIYNDMTVTNQMIEDQGVTVTSLSDEDMQLIRETCIETYKEECEINPNFKMVYESMQAYRETANNYRDWTGDYGFGFNRTEG